MMKHGTLKALGVTALGAAFAATAAAGSAAAASTVPAVPAVPAGTAAEGIESATGDVLAALPTTQDAKKLPAANRNAGTLPAAGGSELLTGGGQGQSQGQGQSGDAVGKLLGGLPVGG